MSPLYEIQQRALAAALSLSARAETLKLVQGGAKGSARLWSARRTLQRRAARRLGLASAQELARLEARIELLSAGMHHVRRQLHSNKLE